MAGTFMSLPEEYRDYFIRNLHDALSGACCICHIVIVIVIVMLSCELVLVGGTFMAPAAGVHVLCHMRPARRTQR